MAIIILVSVSCKSVESVPQITRMETDKHESHVLQRVDTVVVRDSVFVRDSVVLRERTIHDTVYITKEVYRDALNSKFKIQNSIVHDTIHDIQYIEKIIEKPPEKYIPNFYKRCTIILWLLVAFAAVYISIRIFIRR